MPTPQRLPIVNSDDGVWGDIIRQYIAKEHYNDDTDNSINGSHKTVTIRPGTATAGTAPLKFSSGTLLSSPEAGAVEFNSDSLYFTITTGTLRKKIALYDDSSGATGDMYYRNSSGSLVRLPVGSNNKTLRVVSGNPAWTDADPAGQTMATNTRSGNYTVVPGTDVVVLADASGGNTNITLPGSSAASGYRFYIKRIDGTAGNTCIISVTGTDNFEGASATGQISSLLIGWSLTLISNGSSWYII
ncbi:hypothetical protein EPO04_01155 [Patescibacteria group bacterium]|nr:MAG: hypothetical protein EPO04_01155 [Patescibacteria group bacterium]